MQLNNEQANSFTTILDSLQSAEEMFIYNRANQIMNGYPIRIMDECKRKLKEVLMFDPPDSNAYPKLYQYMIDIKALEEEKRIQLQQKEDYKKSAEGIKEEQDREVSRLCSLIISLEQKFQYSSKQAKSYERESIELLSKIGEAKQKLSQFQSEISKSSNGAAT